MICLDEKDVRDLLTMSECIELMDGAMRDLAERHLSQLHRITFLPSPPSSGVMGLMPSHRNSEGSRAFGLKAICVFPGNAAHGEDPHQGVTLLFDGATGKLRAIADGSAVTAMRTAAVTALATRLLAREDARVLALIGAGAQAGDHLEALKLVRDFDEVRVWSRSPERGDTFVSEHASSDVRLVRAETAAQAVAGADVVTTLTPTTEPVLDRSWLKEGAHVNAIGASIARGRELDNETLLAAKLFVDFHEGAVVDGGEVAQAISGNVFDQSHIVGSLAELVSGACEGRTSPDELTVFKSVGMAVEDLATLEMLEQRALAHCVGQRVEL